MTVLRCSAGLASVPRLGGGRRLAPEVFRGLLPRGMETFTFGRERLVREGG